VRSAITGLTLALASCGGGTPDVVQAPVAAAPVVVIPALEDEVVATVPSAPPAPTCPPDALAEHGRCVRVVASPEIPAWTAPSGGHLDPCATWTSEKGIYDCDPRKESASDGGAH
jgi:hypothetical protein